MNSWISRVNQLRAQGMTDKQIESQLSGIVKEANTSMSQTFGEAGRILLSLKSWQKLFPGLNMMRAKLQA